MKDLHMAFLDFWSQFEWNGQKIPAFPTGRVPENQPFPYITFDVVQGSFFSIAFPSTYIWCQLPMDGSYNVQTQRAEIMDSIAAAIPEKGVLLRFNNGMVKLERNDASFMEYYDPEDENEDVPTGEPVIGGKISVAVRFYVY